MKHSIRISVKIFSRWLVALSLICLAHSANAQGRITIPLRFHLVSGMPMTKSGVSMDSWVTRQDIEATIIKEVNRIWKPVGIKFQIESILESPAKDLPNKTKLLNAIVNAKRDAAGKSDPTRLKKLKKLIDWSKHSTDAVNIYLVPFLGETSQGNTSRKQLRIYIGEWTDKVSRAQQAPEKAALLEPLPYKKGSLSRTLAHELGHVLGLKHPDQKTQKAFGLLMGGKKKSYGFTAEEMQTARQQALMLFPQVK